MQTERQSSFCLVSEQSDPPPISGGVLAGNSQQEEGCEAMSVTVKAAGP